MPEVTRCKWSQDNGIVQEYHDKEWGVPVHADQKQFEFLMMEVMQCGLNWTMMLKKREIFRKCFSAFDFRQIVSYDEAKIQEIMETPGMIRSRRKIEAVIHNAVKFIEIINEKGSFENYLKGFAGDQPLIYPGHPEGAIPSRNELSDIISKDLKRRGFKYMGSITVYSHLQACGIINDHVRECFRFSPDI